MVVGLIEGLLPLAVKLITLAIEKKMLNEEQIESFRVFVKTMANRENSSQAYVDAFRKLDAEAEAEYQREKEKYDV